MNLKWTCEEEKSLKARVCMLLPKQFRFLRCDRNSAVFEVVKSAVILTYETQLLNDGSDITARGEVLSAARAYKESMERFKARRFVDKWSVRDGYVATPTFPKHIAHYLSNYSGDRSLY